MLRLHRLRCLLLVAIPLIVLITTANAATAQVYVKGYTKSNGTYVAPHYRSSPDGNFSNNWSTKGNVNPYTGKLGTRVTPPTDYGRSHSPNGYGSSYTNNSYIGLGASQATLSGRANSAGANGSIFFDEPSIELSSTDASNERLRDVAAMSYHGIGFSTTHQQFLKLFQNAKPAGPPDSAGVISYAIEDFDQKRDAIWFQFLDDQFLRLVFAYGETRIVEYGGTRVLDNRAKQRFGTPTRETGTTRVWELPTIDRLVMTSLDGSSWYLAVTKLSTQKAVNSNRAQVDVGF